MVMWARLPAEGANYIASQNTSAAHNGQNENYESSVKKSRVREESSSMNCLFECVRVDYVLHDYLPRRLGTGLVIRCELCMSSPEPFNAIVDEHYFQ
jgi:hypothetical protein